MSLSKDIFLLSGRCHRQRAGLRIGWHFPMVISRRRPIQSGDAPTMSVRLYLIFSFLLRRLVWLAGNKFIVPKTYKISVVLVSTCFTSPFLFAKLISALT